MRRSPTAATPSRRTWSSACARVPARSSTRGAAAKLGRIIEPRYVAMMNAMMRETLIDRHRAEGAVSGLAGRRQDRHEPGFPRRLVHRLHQPPRHRRLARQRRFLADQEGDRRRLAGRNLDAFHADRASGRGGRGAARSGGRAFAGFGISALGSGAARAGRRPKKRTSGHAGERIGSWPAGPAGADRQQQRSRRLVPRPAVRPSVSLLIARSRLS